MRTIQFLDTVCYKPYTHFTLETEGLGGTEASVVRIAKGLHDAYGWNTSIHQPKHSNTVCFGNYLAQPDTIVHIRNPEPIKDYVGLRQILWCHDIPGKVDVDFLSNMSADVVTVSEFHKGLYQGAARAMRVSTRTHDIYRIYNPIPDDLKNAPGVKVWPHRLCFASGPHKGLDYTLEVFKELLKIEPLFELHICVPSYTTVKLPLPDGVYSHGSLNPQGVYDLMRSSLCLFALNHVYPETFGLVYAEADAVGTPVITHLLGAATEVVDHPEETIDVRDKARVVERVIRWSEGERPIVRGRKEFRLKNVLKDWYNLLEKS